MLPFPFNSHSPLSLPPFSTPFLSPLSHPPLPLPQASLFINRDLQLLVNLEATRVGLGPILNDTLAATGNTADATLMSFVDPFMFDNISISAGVDVKQIEVDVTVIAIPDFSPTANTNSVLASVRIAG